MYNMNDNLGMISCNFVTGATWTREEDKMFEAALVLYPLQDPDYWAKIASWLPGKSPEDVKAHYQLLVDDISDIFSGKVEPPNYMDDYDDLYLHPVVEEKKDQTLISSSGNVNQNMQNMGSYQLKKKGLSWTADEHRLFLMGVERYGWSDWKSISRNYVVTRTPVQVASHAQKFQLRQNAVKQGKKRSSIHDITTYRSQNDH